MSKVTEIAALSGFVPHINDVKPVWTDIPADQKYPQFIVMITLCLNNNKNNKNNILYFIISWDGGHCKGNACSFNCTHPPREWYEIMNQWWLLVQAKCIGGPSSNKGNLTCTSMRTYFSGLNHEW